jgi:nucleoside-diphosphate-sugar epimerase
MNQMTRVAIIGDGFIGAQLARYLLDAAGGSCYPKTYNSARNRYFRSMVRAS